MIVSIIKVSKDYCDNETTFTIEGVFCGTEEEFSQCSSHSDPRIEWDQEPEEGWVYKDFSFKQV